MPAIRTTYQIHPQTAEVGLWLELSTSAVGVLTGMPRTAWPSTAGKTLANYQAELNIVYRDLCVLPGFPSTVLLGVQPPAGYYVSGTQLIPMIVEVIITLSSLTPVTISNLEVKDGAMRQVRVG